MSFKFYDNSGYFMRALAFGFKKIIIELGKIFFNDFGLKHLCKCLV